MRRVQMRPVGEHEPPPQILRTSAVDTFVLRSDSLKSTKRRSWAHVDPTTRSTPATATAAALAAAAAASQTAPPPAAIVSATAAAPNTTANGAPRRVVVAPSTAVVAPSPVSLPAIANAAISTVIQPPAKQKQRKNLSFSALFGRRSSSKEGKKTVAPVVAASNTSASQKTPIEVRKQPTIVPAAPSVETPPSAAAGATAPQPRAPAPDAQPTRIVTLTPSKTAIAPSPPKCPLAAADEDCGDSSLEETTLVQDTIAAKSTSPQLVAASSARKVKTIEPTIIIEDRAASASPPEDPPQSARDNGDIASVSSTTTVDDIEQPIIASAASTTTPISDDERRMLAATNEIMRQLNELDVDQPPIVLNEPQSPKAASIVIAAPKMANEAALKNEDDDEDEDDETSASGRHVVAISDEGGGVEIEPYLASGVGQLGDAARSGPDEDDEEERQTTTEEASSNDSDASSANGDPQFEAIVRPTTLRSCMKGANESRASRRMVFDPLVIFLDAALEGELDLVRENAKKIADISQANEEGITGLFTIFRLADFRH